MSDMLRRLIPATEATIVTAETGTEGLQLAAALIPEVIVLDLKLPDLHGLEVLARLRENPELSHIPIVVLTIDDQAQHGLTLSVDEYLVKPVEPNRLISIVRRFYQPKAEVSTPHILLVEDDTALAELFAQTLRTVAGR
jgi:Cache sensor hybrid histidine kinase (EC 2.7.13.3)